MLILNKNMTDISNNSFNSREFWSGCKSGDRVAGNASGFLSQGHVSFFLEVLEEW